MGGQASCDFETAELAMGGGTVRQCWIKGARMTSLVPVRGARKESAGVNDNCYLIYRPVNRKGHLRTKYDDQP